MRILTADIGGTNSRFELFSCQGDDCRSLQNQHYQNRDFHDFEDVLLQFLEDSGATDILAICLALAGPVQQHQRCHLSNIDWYIDAAQIAQRFSLPRPFLLNDFEAIPYGMAWLPASQLLCLQPGEVRQDAPRVFVGPGTGLGQALSFSLNGSLYVLPSEAGHADYAPGGGFQLEILQQLLPQQHGLANEMLISGQGIARLYKVWQQWSGDEDRLNIDVADTDAPARITQAAGEGDSLARKSIELFVELLAGYARNLALQTLPQGGLYLVGGLCNILLPYLQQETFLQGFNRHDGMGHLLQSIPVYVVRSEGVARLGAAYYALHRGRNSAKCL